MYSPSWIEVWSYTPNTGSRQALLALSYIIRMSLRYFKVDAWALFWGDLFANYIYSVD